jgi:hypothetical protein
MYDRHFCKIAPLEQDIFLFFQCAMGRPASGERSRAFTRRSKFIEFPNLVLRRL